MQTPKIAAVILAAGRSSRFGRNKLLEPLAGKVMLRHAIDAALASRADPVIVVTGNESAKIHATLSGLAVVVCNNPDFAKGLSMSLKCGLKAVPADCDGALILLGDMPGIDDALLNRLIAAFDPAQDRSLIVPVQGGRRGNPVLWGREFFAAMDALEGDAGAKALLARHPVWEVEAGSDAPLTDIDTEDALIAWRAR